MKKLLMLLTITAGVVMAHAYDDEFAWQYDDSARTVTQPEAATLTFEGTLATCAYARQERSFTGLEARFWSAEAIEAMFDIRHLGFTLLFR